MSGIGGPIILTFTSQFTDRINLFEDWTQLLKSESQGWSTQIQRAKFLIYLCAKILTRRLSPENLTEFVTKKYYSFKLLELLVAISTFSHRRRHHFWPNCGLMAARQKEKLCSTSTHSCCRKI